MYDYSFVPTVMLYIIYRQRSTLFARAFMAAGCLFTARIRCLNAGLGAFIATTFALSLRCSSVSFVWLLSVFGTVARSPTNCKHPFRPRCQSICYMFSWQVRQHVAAWSGQNSVRLDTSVHYIRHFKKQYSAPPTMNSLCE